MNRETADADEWNWQGPGGTPSWQEPTNWLEGFEPLPGPDTGLVFNLSDGGEVNQDTGGPFELNRLWIGFSAGSYQFTGDPLSFVTGAAPGLLPARISLGSAHDQAIDTPLVFKNRLEVFGETPLVTLRGGTGGPGSHFVDRPSNSILRFIDAAVAHAGTTEIASGVVEIIDHHAASAGLSLGSGDAAYRVETGGSVTIGGGVFPARGACRIRLFGPDRVFGRGVADRTGGGFCENGPARRPADFRDVR